MLSYIEIWITAIFLLGVGFFFLIFPEVPGNYGFYVLGVEQRRGAMPRLAARIFGFVLAAVGVFLVVWATGLL